MGVPEEQLEKQRQELEAAHERDVQRLREHQAAQEAERQRQQQSQEGK